MGRWSQRQRRGGGPGTRPPATITIIQAAVLDAVSGQIAVQFSADIDVTSFTATNFRDLTTGDAADDVTQGDLDTLVYSAELWQGTIAEGDDWQYTDSAPDVITPQSGVLVI